MVSHLLLQSDSDRKNLGSFLVPAIWSRKYSSAESSLPTFQPSLFLLMYQFSKRNGGLKIIKGHKSTTLGRIHKHIPSSIDSECNVVLLRENSEPDIPLCSVFIIHTAVCLSPLRQSLAPSLTYYSSGKLVVQGAGGASLSAASLGVFPTRIKTDLPISRQTFIKSCDCGSWKRVQSRFRSFRLREGYKLPKKRLMSHEPNMMVERESDFL